MSDAAAGASFVIKVIVAGGSPFKFPVRRRVEIGRRDVTEPMPCVLDPRADFDRLIIADLPETSVSRQHLRVEPLEPGQVRLTNTSSKSGVALFGGRRLAPGESCVEHLPVTCQLGERALVVQMPEDPNSGLRSLGDSGRAPGERSVLDRRWNEGGSALATVVANRSEAPLLLYLELAMDVFQSAAGSNDFLNKAVVAAARIAELDTVAILLKRGADWSVASAAHRDANPLDLEWRPSQTIVANVAQDGRTYYQLPAGREVAASLIGVESLVAAPIMDSSHQVIGILYGESRSTSTVPTPVSELKAKLFDLLALGIATGLARVEQEQQIVAQQVRFEQFFTRELARELNLHGDELLAAREADVTVLFCDIKGFSRISADSGAALAIEWVRDVLSDLSDCVARHDGVLVDYGGDSLEALWGAPVACANHAERACEAARAMRASLGELTRRWQSRLGHPTDITIGINSGRAQVGNIGSRRKFKYGALGTTVNLASRVQGATKHLGVSTLITRATADRLGESATRRRLCTVRTVNIAEPVELFELQHDPDASWIALRSDYETALAQFERREFASALQVLGTLLARYPDDQPTRRLLLRNVSCLTQPTEPFDAVWNLDAK